MRGVRRSYFLALPKCMIFSMSLRRTALPRVNVILNWYDTSATALFPASTNAIAYADT